MKVAWWTLRFCRYATNVTVQCCFQVGILNWSCMLSCVKGCSSSWHRWGHGHFHSRNPSNIWTRCGPYCSGGDRWQKPAQAGTEASTSGTCTTLQPPGQIGEAGWQTVQPQGPEPLHTRRLEFHFCYYFSPWFSTVDIFYTRVAAIMFSLDVLGTVVWSLCFQVGQLSGFKNIFCGLVRLWKAWEELTQFWRRSWMSFSNKEESSSDWRATLSTQNIHLLCKLYK